MKRKHIIVISVIAIVLILAGLARLLIHKPATPAEPTEPTESISTTAQTEPTTAPTETQTQPTETQETEPETTAEETTAPAETQATNTQKPTTPPTEQKPTEQKPAAGQQPEKPPVEPTTPATTPPTVAPPATIEERVNSMTTEQLVGQLFLARYPGATQAASDMKTYHIGNFILFGKDFRNESVSSISSTLADLQSKAETPLLIATDEEGGTVTRVSYYSQFRSSKFPSPRSLYNSGGLSLITQTEAEKCRLLRSVGVNVNMGPVCDVTTDSSAFMYSRSLGQDADITSQFVTKVVRTMSDYGIGSVLKHFPGYGNNTDTHIGTSVDERTLESFEQVDLVPFYSGIAAGCDAILVSHNIVSCLDGNAPASLSPAVVGYLRNTMGFSGVIVTDDLVMDAISNRYGVGESAVLAIQAGNDLLCSSDYVQQYKAVLEAVNNGRISMDRLRSSVTRILRWKQELGLI